MTQPPDIVTHRSSSPKIPDLKSATKEKFPSFDDSQRNFHLPPVTESPLELTPGQRLPIEPKWPVRKASHRSRDHWKPVSHGHRPRRSLSDAINNFRTRQGSVSENAQELAEALKAPISWKLIVLCVVWYSTSALTNTSSKSIMNAYPKPVTLTILQFASVSVWCFLLASAASLFPGLKKAVPALKNGLRRPSLDVIATALPLSVFQLLGHLLSSYSTSKIPVSLVHTIKGLSPLFTVLAYRAIYRIRYARATYLSLIPLTLGVMLSCSADFSGNLLGILAAFIATIVFVAQNIFSKKLFTESSRAEADNQVTGSRKLDKLNLLCYCSVGAFLFTAPVWLYTEGHFVIRDLWVEGAIRLSRNQDRLDHGALTMEFVLNGLFHFVQNIMAFVLLSMLSPVSYSVASLIKRVWVIIVAVFWFRSATTSHQWTGVLLTCIGLYLYDRFSSEDAAERRAKKDHFRHQDQPMLPLQEKHVHQNGQATQPGPAFSEKSFSLSDGQSKRHEPEVERHVESGWLPPGTKQEVTWDRTVSPGSKPPSLLPDRSLVQ